MERQANLKAALKISLFLTVLGICTISNAKIIRVDDSATGANNGTSWADAYVYLQDALAEASSRDEIRVAHGLYTPDLGGGNTRGDRHATFQLKNGVEIKGGYVGLDIVEKSDERALNIFETVLSGDLTNNDPNTLSPLDSSQTVVTGGNTDETAILDGFTIAAVFGIGSGLGAGMNIISGSPTIKNCTFVFERTRFSASGNVFRNTNGSSPIITDCTFDGYSDSNTPIPGVSIQDITIMENGQSSPVLTNCTFKNNSNTAIAQSGGSLKLENCSFQNNTIESPARLLFTGGCISNSGGNVTITDCIFTGNSFVSRYGIEGGGACITSSDGNVKITDCIFEGNYTASSGSCIYGVRSSLYIPRKISVSNCVFRNNTAAISGGAISGSNLIIQNCRFSGNTSGRGGAISVFGSEVHNCIFEANRANQGSAVSIYPEFYRSFYNCTFYGNSGGSVIVKNSSTHALNVTGCIIRNNESNVIEGDNVNVTYCNVEGLLPGEGNIDVDPEFVIAGYLSDANDPNSVWVEGDYHLKSLAGHWDSLNQTWISDDVTSPCIDAGDPNSPVGLEPFPNGGIYNIGAYGRSLEASKTFFSSHVCEGILAGDINGDCIVDEKDLYIVATQWMMEGGDFVNQPPQVTLIEPHDGDQITWPGQITMQAEASDADGEIVNVTFKMEYRNNNSTHIITMSDSSSSDGWKVVFTGVSHSLEYSNWTVSATATDNEGAITESKKITITLKAP